MNPGIDMSLEDLQQWNYDLINELRQEKCDAGYTDGDGVLWESTTSAIQNLSGVCVLIACGAVSSDQVWRDVTNVNHTMTPSQLVGLAGALANYIRQCYVTSWTHKAAIEAATDIPTVQDYDVTVSWP